METYMEDGEEQERRVWIEFVRNRRVGHKVKIDKKLKTFNGNQQQLRYTNHVHKRNNFVI